MELPPSPPKSGRFGQIAVYVEVGLERFDALSVNFCQKKHVQNTLNSRTWETPSVLRYGSWKVKPWDPVHGAPPLSRLAIITGVKKPLKTWSEIQGT